MTQRDMKVAVTLVKLLDMPEQTGMKAEECVQRLLNLADGERARQSQSRGAVDRNSKPSPNQPLLFV